jgi:hypothetical protein
MDTLKRIEDRHHFTLPPAYRSFVERGYLTYPGSAYVWVHEAEWLPPTEIAEYRWPSFTKPKPGLVPFAFAANGDLWCWKADRVTALQEPAIAYCPHDSYVGNWHAPCFIGWLYRLSLEYASSMWDDETKAKRNIASWASLIRDFGNKEWSGDLDELLVRSPVQYEWGPRRVKLTGLLTYQELEARIRLAFGKEYLNAPFAWDFEGEPTKG